MEFEPSPEIQRLLDERLRRGGYESADALIHAALVALGEWELITSHKKTAASFHDDGEFGRRGSVTNSKGKRRMFLPKPRLLEAWGSPHWNTATTRKNEYPSIGF